MGRELSMVEELAIEMAIVRLQSEWEQFVRNLILDSATGLYVNSGGRVFGAATAVRSMGRERVLRSVVPSWREPNWIVPNDAIGVARSLGVTNLTNISSYLGISPWKIENLRHIRNFIVHRSKSAAVKFRDHSSVPILGSISPVTFCLSYDSTGTKRYLTWRSFMDLIADGLVR